ncbi:hypothetical protein GOODEAATRI_009169 [Goodea atripinnis]|uniref:Uncharacterized protein n=1 Tax=Goodea atripinnis TaxID=208336 RepID=A0ABV0P2Z0_9TELE
MPHVSVDGPVQPPYVNVAFQQEEITIWRGNVSGCWKWSLIPATYPTQHPYVLSESLLRRSFVMQPFLTRTQINRVRKDMYSDTVNGLVDRHPLELPEPIGPIVHLQEKLFVPVKEYPDVSRSFLNLFQLFS